MTRFSPHCARALALLMCLVLAFGWVPAAALGEATPAPTVDTYDANNPQNLTNENLSGTAALVMDASTGRVLYEKNANKKRYPASTTKIMTLLLALEYGHLEELVTIPKEANDVPSDSSKLGLTVGEQMPFIDLLYGMMMKSGNDASNAVGVIVAGSLSAFVQMMNDRAAELGCENTHFVNTHGYHDADHYSTAYDIAIITREAMKNETFRAIVSCKSYTMSATNEREKRRLETSNSMFVSSSQYYYEYLTGVKTGTHSKAGNCFVGSATKNGVDLISVTLKTSSRSEQWTDTRRLMEYGFSQYQRYSFDELYANSPVYATVENAHHDDENAGLLALTAVPGGTINSFSMYRLPDEYDQTLRDFASMLRVEYAAGLTAPVQQGDIVGTLKLTTEDGTELSTTLIASRDVLAEPETPTLSDFFPWLDSLNLSPLKIGVCVAALILLLIIVLRVRVISRRNRRRREMLRRRRAAYERYRSKDRFR